MCYFSLILTASLLNKYEDFCLGGLSKQPIRMCPVTDQGGECRGAGTKLKDGLGTTSRDCTAR